MSGIFKNFDRLISAAHFNTPNHKFIVKTCLQSFAPAKLYYNKGDQLKAGHGRDVFQMSLVAYEMVRQNQVHQNMLDNLDHEQHANFVNELKQTTLENNSYIQDSISEITLQFQVGISEAPLSALTSFAYVLGQQNGAKGKGVQDFEKYLKPKILEKLQYASQQDLMDLVQALNDLKVTDKAVWGSVLKALENKTFDWQLNNVVYHGWELGQYETPEKPICEGLQSPNERYFNDVMSGKSASWAGGVRNIHKLWDEVCFRVINPFFFREKRPSLNFYRRSGEQEKETLLSNLKAVSSTVPEATKTVQNIQSRSSNY